MSVDASSHNYTNMNFIFSQFVAAKNSAVFLQKIEAKPAAMLVQSRTQQKSFLFLLEEKRELLNFVSLNLKLKDEKVYSTPHNGFEVIAKRAEDGNWLRGLDSNQEFLFQREACYHCTTPH